MSSVISHRNATPAALAGQKLREIDAFNGLSTFRINQRHHPIHAELAHHPIRPRLCPQVKLVSIKRDFSDGRGGRRLAPSKPVKLDDHANLNAKRDQKCNQKKPNYDERWNAVHTQAPCLIDAGSFPHLSGYWIGGFAYAFRYGKVSCGNCHSASAIEMCLCKLPQFSHMVTFARSVSIINVFGDDAPKDGKRVANEHISVDSKTLGNARDYSRSGAGSISCAMWPRRLAGAAAIQLQDAFDFPPTAQSGGGNPAASAGSAVSSNAGDQ